MKHIDPKKDIELQAYLARRRAEIDLALDNLRRPVSPTGASSKSAQVAVDASPLKVLELICHWQAETAARFAESPTSQCDWALDDEIGRMARARRRRYGGEGARP